jgi:hypothetical protein
MNKSKYEKLKVGLNEENNWLSLTWAMMIQEISKKTISTLPTPRFSDQLFSTLSKVQFRFLELHVVLFCVSCPYHVADIRPDS